MAKRRLNKNVLKNQSTYATRSGLEDKALDILTKHNIRFEYEPKNGRLNYIKPETKHTYTPDIVIDGIIYETKGYWKDKEKMLHIKNSNPDRRIVMVFQKDLPIRKGSKTLYSVWCEKNNIEWMLFKDFEKNILKQHGN